METTSVKVRNRRISMRRNAKRSSKVTCRKGVLGLGPNLGISVLDVSEGGVRLIAKSEMKVGDEIEVGLLPPGRMRDVIRKGRIAWIVPTADGQFCVGIQFDKRLDYATLLDLTNLPTA